MRPKFSVILPTYNEAESLPSVIRSVRAACRGRAYEIIVVDDDSPDGSASVARREGARVLVRKNKRGLASAILDGFLAARTPYVFVMDADGQHDLANFKHMVDLLLEGKADLVVASRYISKSGMKMPWHRRMISSMAGLLARPLMGTLSDPMSGFFGVRRKPLLRVRHWSLMGFKLLPEIMVRCPKLRMAEVPLVFGERKRGRSKMDAREVADYIRLLANLYMVRLENLLFT